MVMTSERESKSWKYGGQADFSYANIFAAVAVKATYDGSQSGAEAKVKVNCTSYLSGSVLTTQIDEWFRKVENKTFNELADVNVMREAQNMVITHGAHSIHDFVPPNTGNDIISQLKEKKKTEDR